MINIELILIEIIIPISVSIITTATLWTLKWLLNRCNHVTAENILHLNNFEIV